MVILHNGTCQIILTLIIFYFKQQVLPETNGVRYLGGTQYLSIVCQIKINHFVVNLDFIYLNYRKEIVVNVQSVSFEPIYPNRRLATNVP